MEWDLQLCRQVATSFAKFRANAPVRAGILDPCGTSVAFAGAPRATRAGVYSAQVVASGPGTWFRGIRRGWLTRERKKLRQRPISLAAQNPAPATTP